MVKDDVVPAVVVAKRVRAGLAYAALTYNDAARLTQINVPTLRRIASPTNPRGATLSELARIAAACKIPPEWFTSGHWSDSDNPELPGLAQLGTGPAKQRLYVLEHYVRQLIDVEHQHGTALMPPPGQKH